VELSVAGKKPRGAKKTRTRQHVLADLAVNYVERQVLLCGHSVERIEHDYGIDLVMFTYTESGEIENGRVLLQVKGSDHVRRLKDQKTIALAISQEDLKLWLREPDPVILVLYDGTSDRAHWLYVQACFEAQRSIDLFRGQGKITVHIPTSNRLDRRAIRALARYREQVQAQITGRIRHHA
jgi:hypothetical protein